MATTNYQAGLDTNDVVFSYAPEATWGTLPAVQFQQARFESEGFGKTKTRQRPNEINSTGQVSAAVTTKEEAKGDLKVAISAGNHFDILAASIMSTPATAVNMTASTIAAVADGFTDSANGFVSGNVTAGAWLRVKGFTGGSAASINGYYQVLTVAAGKITTLPAPGATKTAGDSVTLTGQKALNGTTFQSFYAQKQLAAAIFRRYPGIWPTSGSVSAALGGFFESSVSFLVKDELKSTTDASTGALIPSSLGNVIDTVNGFGTIYRGAAAINAVIQKVDLKWQINGARAQYGLGSSAAQGMGKGLLEPSGSIEMYFKDDTYYDEFVSETGGMLSFRGVDDTGAGYIYTLGNAKFMNPKIVAGGPGQDIMATFDVEGNPTASNSIWGGQTFQIDKVT